MGGGQSQPLLRRLLSPYCPDTEPLTTSNSAHVGTGPTRTATRGLPCDSRGAPREKGLEGTPTSGPECVHISPKSTARPTTGNRGIFSQWDNVAPRSGTLLCLWERDHKQCPVGPQNHIANSILNSGPGLSTCSSKGTMKQRTVRLGQTHEATDPKLRVQIVVPAFVLPSSGHLPTAKAPEP